jgi:hypothetical protein
MGNKKDLPKIIEKPDKHFSIDLSKFDPLQVIEVFRTLVDAKKELENTKEQEATKRYAIDTDLKKFLIRHEDKKQFLKEYFHNQFSDRREAMQKTFEVLDSGLDEHNDANVSKALDALVGIVRANPLKGLDEIGKAFENDDEDLVI